MSFRFIEGERELEILYPVYSPRQLKPIKQKTTINKLNRGENESSKLYLLSCVISPTQ